MDYKMETMEKDGNLIKNKTFHLKGLFLNGSGLGIYK